ncbi:5'-nucleotidase /3'-nucleotidase /exopolyphosphatase [Roseibium hamelinense]|uniref:5'-nucleotidase SurE n=1 Tax=Roseibium hamelinense TaxID=150831 RepID=A0A562THM7_9HYPH|nr:5'/3'-nucleotidase SurE [Roseibium hamelinense]MTI45676.1 5'/3'-nucleotidase SurE [Roseibium hamelinense]TWI93141.1 5'-nucleotidase /3'-nucleotidase /exopolyphosphatase [Roseibium hamelinense]
MRILITNDDGIHSSGLSALERIARSLSDDIWVIAPETDQSGVAHSLTLSEPLRLRQVSEKHFALKGTPTDCVIMGVRKVLPGLPDLVLSGINRGQNLGEDVTYSGTVAGAMEAAILGIPAIAVSQAYNWDISSEPPYETAEAHAPELFKKLLQVSLPDYALFNVNFPACAPDQVQGIKATVQGHHEQSGLVIDERRDPRGYPYYWLGFRDRGKSVRDNSDLHAIADRFVSVTPLRIDLTAHDMVAGLARDLS